MSLFRRPGFAAAVVLCALAFGCKKSTGPERIVIWTNCSELAQYTELYNRSQHERAAVLVYKPNPMDALPPAKDELKPDIIIGSWLRNDAVTKNFKRADFLFRRKNLSPDAFYENLLEAGKVKNKSYLLPVSFNLPAVIFSADNEQLIPYYYTISPVQIRKLGSAYNLQNAKGGYTRIGFCPLDNSEFLYLCTKFYHVDFRAEKDKVVWNDANLEKFIGDINDWVATENTSAQAEQDFSYKYLAMPDYRKVTSGRTLFAYTTSDQLFRILKNQNLNIDYRWVADADRLPLEDSFTMLGIYKDSQKRADAADFISWFFRPETQQEILRRKADFNLDTDLFGIAGGFSAVREVTEQILPLHYNRLLTNIPQAHILEVPQKLPPKWNYYKNTVVEPYLSAATSGAEETVSIYELEREWQKKVFD